MTPSEEFVKAMREAEVTCPCKTSGWECGDHGCNGGCLCDSISGECGDPCSWPGHAAHRALAVAFCKRDCGIAGDNADYDCGAYHIHRDKCEAEFLRECGLEKEKEATVK